MAEHGDRTRRAILAAGIELWREDATKVSAKKIGTMIGMTHSAVLYHFGSSVAMRTAIAHEAIKVRDRVIVPMLIAGKHPAAETLSEADRRQYLNGC